MSSKQKMKHGMPSIMGTKEGQKVCFFITFWNCSNSGIFFSFYYTRTYENIEFKFWCFTDNL